MFRRSHAGLRPSVCPLRTEDICISVSHLPKKDKGVRQQILFVLTQKNPPICPKPPPIALFLPSSDRKRTAGTIFFKKRLTNLLQGDIINEHSRAGGKTNRGIAQFGRVRGLGPRCRRFESCCPDQYADVAELADALDSGSSGSDTVGVQVPSSAPKRVFLRHVGTLAFLFSAGSAKNAAKGCIRHGYSRLLEIRPCTTTPKDAVFFPPGRPCVLAQHQRMFQSGGIHPGKLRLSRRMAGQHRANGNNLQSDHHGGACVFRRPNRFLPRDLFLHHQRGQNRPHRRILGR